MQIKDDNYKMKLELQELKRKNEYLEKKIETLQNQTINSNQQYHNETNHEREVNLFIIQVFKYR